MRTAVGWSMVLSGTTYATIGVSGFMVFGRAVQGDVLSNLNIDDVAAIMGGNVGAAMAFVATVKVAMAISMVLSFPITIWPMREDIIEMLAHSLGSSTQLSPAAYYTLTYTSLLVIYLVAVVIQSAYSVVGIVGATCGTTMGFMFPGMLALRDPQGGAAYKAFGWGLLAAGTVLFAVGVTAS
jgi:amino acid permease